MPADEAQAQMNPAIACSQTILAARGARRYSLDLIQMGARLRHVFISIVNGKLHLFRRMPFRRGERLIELGKYARGCHQSVAVRGFENNELAGVWTVFIRSSRVRPLGACSQAPRPLTAPANAHP